MRTEKYRLYAAPFNTETATVALSESYSRATKTHVLIYKRGKCPDGFKEMTDDTIHLLPSADRKWLLEMNMALIQEFVQKDADRKESANKKFLEEFEKELEKERLTLSQQGSDAK